MLQSMTGFARAEGGNDQFSWTWELRSVNGKGLDIRFRIPSGFEAVEIPARKRAQESLSRGNVQMGLQIQQTAPKKVLKIDEQLIGELVLAAQKVAAKVGGDLPSAADLLAIRGVVELEEGAEQAVTDETIEQILNSLEDGLEQLGHARSTEGAEIGKVLQNQLSSIESMLSEIEKDPARQPDAIKEHMKDMIDRLLSESSEFDEQRLHQEAVVLSLKADITEELDRLRVHVGAARDMISKGGAIGRKLDFLAQEFNRECNTICSKSNSASMTAVGLDMKLVIDQFREQLQNME